MDSTWKIERAGSEHETDSGSLALLGIGFGLLRVVDGGEGAGSARRLLVSVDGVEVGRWGCLGGLVGAGLLAWSGLVLRGSVGLSLSEGLV